MPGPHEDSAARIREAVAGLDRLWAGVLDLDPYVWSPQAAESVLKAALAYSQVIAADATLLADALERAWVRVAELEASRARDQGAVLN